MHAEVLENSSIFLQISGGFFYKNEKEISSSFLCVLILLSLKNTPLPISVSQTLAFIVFESHRLSNGCTASFPNCSSMFLQQQFQWETSVPFTQSLQ